MEFHEVNFLSIGVDWNECVQVGSLFGKKLVLNEFIAYLDMKELMGAEALSHKSLVISTFALCGFANLGSIAIQIGGIGGLIPEQQANISKLGMKSLLAATLANLMTAAMAGALF